MNNNTDNNDNKLKIKNEIKIIDKQLLIKYEKTKKDMKFYHYLLENSNSNFYIIVKNLL